jgi:hypothetical protein
LVDGGEQQEEEDDAFGGGKKYKQLAGRRPSHWTDYTSQAVRIQEEKFFTESAKLMHMYTQEDPSKCKHARMIPFCGIIAPYKIPSPRGGNGGEYHTRLRLKPQVIVMTPDEPSYAIFKSTMLRALDENPDVATSNLVEYHSVHDLRSAIAARNDNKSRTVSSLRGNVVRGTNSSDLYPESRAAFQTPAHHH